MSPLAADAVVSAAFFSFLYLLQKTANNVIMFLSLLFEGRYSLKGDFVLKKSKVLRRIGIIVGSIFIAVMLIWLIFAVANAIYRGNMKKYIDNYGKVEYENQITPNLDERGNYYFTTDGDFKVMQLTDVHIGGGFLFSGGDKKAIHAVASMIEVEKPDLVIVTGDISYTVPWCGTLNNATAHGFFKRLMENLGVYWTVTFGNHDSEKYNLHDRAAVAEMYSDPTLKYCLFSAGPEDIFGECNHVINIKDSQGLVTSSFIMIDSNAYTDKDVFGLGWDYDNVHEDQIAWYRENIEYYTEENRRILVKSLGEGIDPSAFKVNPVTSYIYMHIPPEEMKTAYNEAVKGDISDTEKYGIVGEDGQVVYCSAYPDNFFETVVELGSTKGIFFGHDHLNSLHLTYKGVLLSYGCSIDYSAYAGSTGYQRGCTLLTLKKNGYTELRHSNYYSGLYDNLNDKVDMTLPEMYR